MILSLGGTGDAHQLALAFQAENIDFIVSLAGITKRPVERPYAVRTGGFGGIEGLTTYIENNDVTGIIDATHPFAENISKSAAKAALQTGLPLVRYIRPEWDISKISPPTAPAATIPLW